MADHSRGMIGKSSWSASVILMALGVGACGSNEEKPSGCVVETNSGCDSGQVCELVDGGEPACFAEVKLRGMVSDASTGEPVEGARILARDVNGALLSRGVATSDEDGHYTLGIPARRTKDGEAILPEALLRADAGQYRTFPGGLRVAIPVDMETREETNRGVMIENPTTNVALDPLPGGSPLATIRGRVITGEPAGTLVVAGSASAVASTDGSFTLFNVAENATEVRGYKANTSLSAAAVSVRGSQVVDGVELRDDGEPVVTVSGDVSFVNAGVQETSVVMVVKSTFDATLIRGEVPAGLRLFPVGGRYEFTGVPAGDYVILAAFENDGLVRDPDTSIGGTAVQNITVAGAAATVPGFKITGALAVMAPGADGPDVVTGTPNFVWQDDSSEDGYEVVVYDGLGNEVWRDPAVSRVTGSATVSYEYPGDQLTRGYYQFRATSYHEEKDGSRTYISATEDLKGVFVIP